MLWHARILGLAHGWMAWKCSSHFWPELGRVWEEEEVVVDLLGLLPMFSFVGWKKGGFWW